jgi:SNF2 family DNA or RNA helicase
MVNDEIADNHARSNDAQSNDRLVNGAHDAHRHSKDKNHSNDPTIPFADASPQQRFPAWAMPNDLRDVPVDVNQPTQKHFEECTPASARAFSLPTGGSSQVGHDLSSSTETVQSIVRSNGHLQGGPVKRRPRTTQTAKRARSVAKLEQPKTKLHLHGALRWYKHVLHRATYPKPDEKLNSIVYPAKLFAPGFGTIESIAWQFLRKERGDEFQELKNKFELGSIIDLEQYTLNIPASKFRDGASIGTILFTTGEITTESLDEWNNCGAPCKSIPLNQEMPYAGPTIFANPQATFPKEISMLENLPLNTPRDALASVVKVNGSNRIRLTCGEVSMDFHSDGYDVNPFLKPLKLVSSAHLFLQMARRNSNGDENGIDDETRSMESQVCADDVDQSLWNDVVAWGKKYRVDWKLTRIPLTGEKTQGQVVEQVKGKKRTKQNVQSEKKTKCERFHIVISASIHLTDDCLRYGTHKADDGFINPRERSFVGTKFDLRRDRRLFSIVNWFLYMNSLESRQGLDTILLGPLPRLPLVEGRASKCLIRDLVNVKLDMAQVNQYYNAIETYYSDRLDELPESMRPSSEYTMERRKGVEVSMQDVLESVRPPIDGPSVDMDRVHEAGLAAGTQLYNFQKRVVQWMIMKEETGGRDSGTLLHPHWIPLFIMGETMYINENSGTLSRTRFVSPENEPGAFLSDEMGLGKTLDVISLILLRAWEENRHDKSRSRRMLNAMTHERTHRVDSVPRMVRTSLIVAPAAILGQWLAEIKQHVEPGKLKVGLYDAGSYLQNVSVEGMPRAKVSWDKFEASYFETVFSKYDIILTAYESLQKDLSKTSHQEKSPLLRVQWWRLILDEAQLVSHTSGKAAMMANELWRCNGWTVTGTPVSNDIMDLHGVLVALDCDPWSASPLLQKSIISPFKSGDAIGAYRLRGTLSHMLWRNAKIHVGEEFSLPTNYERVLEMEFSKPERVLYQRKSVEHKEALLAHYRGNGHELAMSTQVIPRLLDLRQLCLHPQINHNLFNRAERRMNWREMLAKVAKTAMDEKHGLELDLVREMVMYCTACRWHLHTNAKEEKVANALPTLQEWKRTLDKAIELVDKYVEELTKRDDWLPAVVGYFGFLRKADLQKWMRVKFYVLEEYRQILCLLGKSRATGFAGREMEGPAAYVKFHQKLHKEIPDVGGWRLMADVCREQNLIKRYMEESEEGLEELPAYEASWRREDPTERLFQHNFNYTADVGVLLEKKARFRANQHLQNAAIEAFKDVDLDLAEVDRMAREEREQNQLNKSERTMFREMQERREKGLDAIVESHMANMVGPRQVQTLENSWQKLSAQHEQRWKEGAPRFTLQAIMTRSNVLRDDIRKKATELTYTLNTLEDECRRLGVDVNNVLKEARVADEVQAKMVARINERDENAEIMPVLKIPKVEKDKIQTTLAQNGLEAGPEEGDTVKMDKACIICLDEFHNPVAVRSCLHKFCFDCIRQAIKTRPNCPVCRVAVNARTDLIEIQLDNVADASDNDELVRDGFQERSLNDVRGEWGTKISVLVCELKRHIKLDATFKAVVFSTWNPMLDFVSQALLDNDVDTVKFYGSAEVRTESLRRIREDDLCKVILVPLRGSSGAAGLTLTSCQYAYLIEPSLNPGLIDQAISRISRIGQTKTTHVVHLIISPSVENKIRELQRKKRLQTHLVGSEKEDLQTAEVLDLFEISPEEL